MVKARADIDRITNQIQSQLNAAVDEILEFIPTVQIQDYSATAHPSLRRRQKYVRTFNLRDSSKTERISTNLPEISGRWFVDETIAPYGVWVLGLPSEQAKAHRGRWKSKTNVENQTKKIAPLIIEKHLEKLK